MTTKQRQSRVEKRKLGPSSVLLIVSGVALGLWPVFSVLLTGEIPVEMKVVWVSWFLSSGLLGLFYYLREAGRDHLTAVITAVLMFGLFMVANISIFYVGGLFAIGIHGDGSLWL
jgi:hypothetical protein